MEKGCYKILRRKLFSLLFIAKHMYPPVNHKYLWPSSVEAGHYTCGIFAGQVVGNSI